MHPLTKLLQSDIKPALGVTEPGAIALACATARTYAPGDISSIMVRLSSGILKNSYECGIPNTDVVGCAYAAALGAICGDPARGLMSLENVSQECVARAKALVEQGSVTVEMSSVSPVIHIEAKVTTGSGTSTVTIAGDHTNIIRITKDGEVVLNREFNSEPTGEEYKALEGIRISDLVEYAQEIDVEEIRFLQSAFDMNLELFKTAIDNPRCPLTAKFLADNGDSVISRDAERTALTLVCGALEARVTGAKKPAMSLTGSGAHGIICFMPLYAYHVCLGTDPESLYRAAALAALITCLIKKHSGKLSAYCGCAIGGGTGTACGLTYLQGGGVDEVSHVINNMGSSLTGMICTGGNSACVLKASVGVRTAYQMSHFACSGYYVSGRTGMNGMSPEETILNMGRIASPGMLKTEETIMEIILGR